MTIHITTGPSPGHPGACIAHYNHHVLNHTLHPSQQTNPHYHYLPQYIQHPPTAWIPPVSSYPPFY